MAHDAKKLPRTVDDPHTGVIFMETNASRQEIINVDHPYKWEYKIKDLKSIILPDSECLIIYL